MTHQAARLPIVQKSTKGIAAIVDPLVSTFAKKLKNCNVLHNLKKKLGAVHSSSVLGAIHDSHVSKCRLDETHFGIKKNPHQLDDHIRSLEPELDNDLDFSTLVQALVAWHKRASKK